MFMNRTTTNVSTKKVWVTAYEVRLEYGGPEEGGWYYTSYYPAETLYVEKGNVEQAINDLKGKHQDDLPGGSIYSVRGGHQIEIHIETKRQQRKTSSRPRWE